MQWIDSLTEAVQPLKIPSDEGFIWAADESHAMAALRKQILTKPGANPKRMRIAVYRKHGEPDHHEELKSTD